MNARNQYLKVLQEKYFMAKSRKEKSLILDEYCSNTHQNRKYVIRKRWLAFSDYLGVGLSSFAGTIREGQILALFSVVLLPLSLYAFKMGVRKAKKEGSLTHY